MNIKMKEKYLKEFKQIIIKIAKLTMLQVNEKNEYLNKTKIFKGI